MNAEQATNKLKEVQGLYSLTFYEQIIHAHIHRKTLANQNKLKLYTIFGDSDYQIAPMPNALLMIALEERLTDLGYSCEGSADLTSITWEWPNQILETNGEHLTIDIPRKRFDHKKYTMVKSICFDAISIATLLILLGSILFLASQASKYLERQTPSVIEYDSLPKIPRSSAGGSK